MYLTITGQTFESLVKVEPKKHSDAWKFAAAVNNAA